MSLGTTTMGRPKKGTRKPPEPSPSNDDRVAIIHLKGSSAYAEWLEAAHQQTHIPKATIVRLAIQQWAQANKLPVPPEI